MSTALLPFPDMRPLAARIAPLIEADIHPVGWRHFPDGESLVTLAEGLAGRDVALLATLRDADRLALPLRFAAATARELGARRVGLIAPYLGYMRQDARFHPGEVVSAPIFARFLEESFDWLVTADPHLHRNTDLSLLFRIPAARAVTAPLVADWIAANVADAVLLGPDSESQQWVADVARRAGRPYEVLHKVRHGDRSVDIGIPESPELRRGTPVILDDIASSGQTMAQAVRRLAEAGTHPPVCIVIHAVFADAACRQILAAGAARIISTDTIPHPTNAIKVAPVLAATVKIAVDLPAVGSITTDVR